MNKALLILGGGAVLYWWYSQQTPAAAATTGTPTPTPTPQPTVPSPQPGNVTVTPTPAATPPPASPPPVVSASALDAAFAAIQAHARQDPSLLDASGNPSATFSQWNWYLMTYGGQSDLPSYYDATNGQTDPNTPMSALAYWGVIGPWLKAKRGLSGIGAYGPAYRPAYRRSPYLGPGGWLA